jgi:hypothetical protein
MRDLLGLSFSVAVPWIAGTLWIRAASNRPAPHAAALRIGYGYLVGLFGITLVMRVLSLAGQRWSVAWIALPVAALTAGAYWHGRSRNVAPGAEPAMESGTAVPPLARGLFWILLLLTCIRTIMLAIEVTLTPLVPYDALAHWATKSRVWFEYGRMTSFVQDAEWGRAAGTMHFTDTHPEYPGTVPLFQVWTALCLGRWDESLINVPWIAAFVSLGIAFHAQVRRLGIDPLKAMFGTYVLLSLPYLTIHVALAGYADMFLAIAYAMAAMALWQWTIGRRWHDAGLALVMAIICALLKLEGILWVMTLVPGVMIGVNRRLGMVATVVVAAAAVLYLAFAPSELRILGYTLRTHFDDVSRPLFQHLFVMDNWHLLWYAAIAVVMVNGRLVAGTLLAPMSGTILAAAAFIVVVFFFSNASGGVRDETLTNRLLLHVVPALVFYLAAILHARSIRTAPPARM